MKIEYDSLIAFCRTLIGRKISTVGGRSFFTVTSVNFERIGYTISTGNTRYTEKIRIEKVLDNFANTGSLKTTDYTDFTQAASYTLALIREYLNRMP